MKKILVGLDGSSHQKGVLAAASELARRTGAKLVLFRAVGLPTELARDAYKLRPSEVTTTLEQEALAAAEESARDLPAELVDSVRVAIGAPWEAICQAACEADVDMIAIGSHGYDTLDRILGTTAAKVVNHADRAVLVVRSPERITTSTS